ncbi:putative Microtubule binding protein MOR1 [Blattamonas nauphoetae]|uniref:Microtubule binding protein MOR1 n=1 Tax=Blattamonas nauphoetae TaxID=2049346 RepID=A0ABQ9YA08_9EUKA|nr:putative Microtubule binding protein MOR1 [Blattamonas nauphoetae]
MTESNPTGETKVSLTTGMTEDEALSILTNTFLSPIVCVLLRSKAPGSDGQGMVEFLSEEESKAEAEASLPREHSIQDILKELSSKDWKVRQSAVAALFYGVETFARWKIGEGSGGALDGERVSREICEVSDAAIRECLVHPSLKDSNIGVCASILKGVGELGQSSIETSRSNNQRIVFVSERGIGSLVNYSLEKMNDARCKSASHELMDVACILYGPGFVMDRAYKICLQQKTPKVQGEITNWIVKTVKGFGGKSVSLKELFGFITQIAESRDGTVRNGAIQLCVVQMRSRPAIFEGMLRKMAQPIVQAVEKQLQSEESDGNEEILTLDQQLSGNVGNGGEEMGMMKDDEEDLLGPRKDISKKLEKYQKQFGAQKWEEKKAALNACTEIIRETNKRCAVTGLSEFAKIVGRHLEESNKNLAAELARLMGLLAQSCGSEIHEIGRFVVPKLFKLLGDSQTRTREWTLEALDEWVLQVGLCRMFSQCVSGLQKQENQSGKKESLSWMLRQIIRVRDVASGAEKRPSVGKVSSVNECEEGLRALVAVVVERLQDGQLEIRNLAGDVGTEIARLIGIEPFWPIFQELKPTIQSSVRPLIDKIDRSSRLPPAQPSTQASSSVPHSTAPAVVVEPSKAHPKQIRPPKTSMDSKLSRMAEVSSAPKEKVTENVAMLVDVEAAVEKSEGVSLTAGMNEEQALSILTNTFLSPIVCVLLRSKAPGSDGQGMVEFLSEEESKAEAEASLPREHSIQDILKELSSKDWKVRQSAVAALFYGVETFARWKIGEGSGGALDGERVSREICEVSDAAIRECLVHPSLKDSNIGVCASILKGVGELGQSSIETSRSNNQRIVFVSERGIGSLVNYSLEKMNDARCKSASHELMDVACILYGPGFVMDRAYKICLQQKTPKVQGEITNWIVKTVKGFGGKSVSLKELFGFITQIAESRDGTVRNGAIQLCVVQMRSRPAIFEGMLRKMAQPIVQAVEKQLQSEESDGSEEILTLDQQLSGNVGNGGEEMGMMKDDEEDLLGPRKDISKKLEKYQKQFGAQKWEEKKAALNACTEIIRETNKRCAVTGLSEFAKIVGRHLEESNKNLAAELARLMGLLAQSCGSEIHEIGRFVVPKLFKLLGDSQTRTREWTLEALDEWVLQVGLGRMFSQCVSGLQKQENQSGKKESLSWMLRQIIRVRDVASGAEKRPSVGKVSSVNECEEGLRALVAVVVERLQDGQLEIRNLAGDVGTEIARLIGIEPFWPIFQELKPTIQSSVRPLIDKIAHSINAPSRPIPTVAAPSGIRPPSIQKPTRTSSQTKPGTISPPPQTFSAADQPVDEVFCPASTKQSRRREWKDFQNILLQSPNEAESACSVILQNQCLGTAIFDRLNNKSFQIQISALNDIISTGSSQPDVFFGLSDVFFRWSASKMLAPHPNPQLLKSVGDLIFALLSVGVLNTDLSRFTQSPVCPPSDVVCNISPDELEVLLLAFHTMINKNPSSVPGFVIELLSIVVSFISPNTTFSHLIPYFQTTNKKSGRTPSILFFQCVSFAATLLPPSNKKEHNQIVKEVCGYYTHASTDVRKAALLLLSMYLANPTLVDVAKQLGWKSTSSMDDAKKRIEQLERTLTEKERRDQPVYTGVVQSQPKPIISQPSQNQNMNPFSQPSHTSVPPSHHTPQIQHNTMASPFLAQQPQPLSLEADWSVEDWQIQSRLILPNGNPTTILQLHKKLGVLQQKNSSMVDSLVSVIVDPLTIGFQAAFSGLVETIHRLPVAALLSRQLNDQNAMVVLANSIRLAKYSLNSLLIVSNTPTRGKFINQAQCKEVFKILLSSLLNPALSALEDGEANLLPLLNNVMLHVLEHVERTNAFIVLIQLLDELEQNSVNIFTPTEQEMNFKLSQLTTKCLTKLNKALPRSIQDIQFNRLVPVLDTFLFSHADVESPGDGSLVAKLRFNHVSLLKTILINLVTCSPSKGIDIVRALPNCQRNPPAMLASLRGIVKRVSGSDGVAEMDQICRNEFGWDDLISDIITSEAKRRVESVGGQSFPTTQPQIIPNLHSNVIPPQSQTGQPPTTSPMAAPVNRSAALNEQFAQIKSMTEQTLISRDSLNQPINPSTQSHQSEQGQAHPQIPSFLLWKDDLGQKILPSDGQAADFVALMNLVISDTPNSLEQLYQYVKTNSDVMWDAVINTPAEQAQAGIAQRLLFELWVKEQESQMDQNAFIGVAQLNHVSDGVYHEGSEGILEKDDAAEDTTQYGVAAPTDQNRIARLDQMAQMLAQLTQ